MSRRYLLDIHVAPGVIGLSWDNAPEYPIRDSIEFEVPDDVDGAERADDIMAERGCPDERGVLWWLDHPVDGVTYDVTISGEDAGLVRCGHQH